MQKRTLISGMSAAIVFAAIGCSDSTSPSGALSSFDSEVTADIAPSAAEDIASDVSFFSGADASGSGGTFAVVGDGATIAGDGASAQINYMPAGAGVSAWISSRCTFDAGTGRFVCPPIVRGHQNYTISYALYDASGVNQSAYDNVTTASINFVVTDSGATSYTWNGNTFADTLLRRHDRTVTGLAGNPDTVHTWNGNGTGSIHTTHTGQITKRYVLAANDTATNIKFRQPRGINPYPLSGTFVKNYTVTRTREASDTTTHTATRRVVVTFNGTADVPMTINDVAYSLNLDTHRATKQ